MSYTGSTSDAERGKRKAGRFLGCFFTVFFLMMLGFTAVFVWPVVQIVRAMDWNETPCTILSSQVETHRGKKGATYSVAVSYEYFVHDQRYVSTRYKFMSGSSSGYDGKAQVVQRLRPGTTTVCYVNRRDPAEAVIERGFTADLLFGLIPLLFAVIGAGGLYRIFLYKGKGGVDRPNDGLPAAAVSGSRTGPAVLKPASSPATRFGCLLVFALAWNGFLSIFLIDVVSDWRSGKGFGCSTLGMIPFVLVGVLMILLSIHGFLALFNPRPVIRLSSSAAALGETVEVDWEVTGNVDRLRVFTIAFEGREEATYRRGKWSSTYKSVFLTLELVTLTRANEMRRGKAKVAIPTDTMHTFRSTNNKILWRFQVKGDIPWWPDVDESFDFEVLPHRLGAGAAS